MYQNWINSRGLRTLNYQENAVTKVNDSLEKQEITVLAACPSAGKTIMTIHVIDEYLQKHPNHKVMVLTHGTTVLRTQFHDELLKWKPNFSFNLVETSNKYDNNSQVNICLPQTLKAIISKLKKIDLLIVDEAHQFYYGEKLIKDIIEKTKPKRQLLLTGSPSPFIEKNIPIIPITLNTIYDEGMVSDLYVEIATSSYQFDFTDDYNEYDELKSTVHFKDSDTKKTLDDLIGKIVDRLKSIKGNDLINFTGWLPTLKHLQKTMIACKSQMQARQVKHYFDRIGVKSALSISDTDYDSVEIENFKQDKDCLVLIVVGRGILGFNYSELVNVVDMTISRNIDRVYQLLCRVIRIHPRGEKKLFVKVAPNIHSDYFKYFMTAVLSMSEAEFFTKYNGKNFNDMEIPVLKNTNKRNKCGDNKEEDETINCNSSSKKKFKPHIFEGLPVFKFFKDLYHKKDALYHTYAYTTIRDVRAEFMKTMPNGYWNNIEHCIESALRYNNTTEWFKYESSAYNAARKNGWWDECTVHMTNKHKSCRYWTFEKCKEVALKYNTKIEFKNNEPSAYVIAKSKGWMNECTKHMVEGRRVNGYWTKDKCLESALQYNTIKEWSEKDSSAYSMAKEYGYIDECKLHMKSLINPNGTWTLEKCLEIASKYDNISDWKKYDGKSYSAARNHDKSNGNTEWYDICKSHMTPKVLHGIWCKENCIIEASKYNTKTEWKKCGNASCQIAYKNKWIDECTKHMKK